MKKILVALLSVTMLTPAFWGTSVYASDNLAQITGVSADNGIVSVKTINQADNDIIFTLRVIKEDDTLPMDKRVYALLQERVQAGAEMSFKIRIKDEKNGVLGAGRYRIVLEKDADFAEGDEIFIDFADSADIEAFVNLLKEIVGTASDQASACATLLNVIIAEENKGELFSMGFDFNLFGSQPEVVQKDAVSILYASGLSTMTAVTLPDVLQTCFGVAVYNNGAKIDGIEIIKPLYGGREVNAEMMASTTALMDSSYPSVAEFRQGFTLAYGIVTIANARVDGMEMVLDTFVAETGECVSSINKIKGLIPAKRYIAFEHIVNAVAASCPKTETGLETILDAAYTYALSAENSVGSSSGGGGGGGVGAPSISGSVATTMGSGTPEEKKENTYVFTDMKDSHWAAEAVLWLKNKGIVNGTETGSFEPERTVTREEFAKMLVAACGLAPSGYITGFSDIESGAWYEGYIGAAAETGIVNGMGDGTFGIGQTITRQDMAVMVKRAIDNMGIILKPERERDIFTDEKQIAGYALESVLTLFESGIINGKGGNQFDPQGNATRAEAAKIIYEAFKGGN